MSYSYFSTNLLKRIESIDLLFGFLKKEISSIYLLFGFARKEFDKKKIQKSSKSYKK
jgi:hypothetical protein